MGIGAETGLIFTLNSIVDENEHEDITFDNIRNALSSGDLINWLTRKFPKEDFTFLDKDSSRRITASIYDISISVEPSRKFGVTNNGICWLIAMIVELLQRRVRLT